jgi:hypothetical protein
MYSLARYFASHHSPATFIKAFYYDTMYLHGMIQDSGLPLWAFVGSKRILCQGIGN